MRQVFRYTFPGEVPLDHVEDSLTLCALATEILHGAVQTRLEVGYLVDRGAGRCIIDGTSPAGRDFNRLFAGLIIEEFGAESFEVRRIDEPTSAPANTAA
jgi:hypothetical protein